MKQVRWWTLAALVVAAIPAIAGAEGRRSTPILFVRSLGGYQLYRSTPQGFEALPFDTAPRRHPSLSPDGTRLAYSRLDHGNWDLYVVPTSGGTALRLTTAPGFDGYPTWSPDGTTIAFESNTSGSYQVATIPAEGGTQKLLTSSPTYGARPAWSPDGTRIAYELYQEGSWHLAVMNADGSQPHRLDPGVAYTGEPAWSPDGGSIAFERASAQGTAIWLMNADGSGSRRVIDGFAPAFSPSGTTIVFQLWDRLWTVRLDGSGVVLLYPEGSEETDASWSSSGSLVFASTKGKTSEVFSIRPDGSGERQLTHAGRRSGFAVWTPDHRSVLFDRLAGGRDRIYEVRANGAGEHALHATSLSEVPLRVSPDGRKILLLGSRDLKGSQLYVMNRDGSNARRLARIDGVGAGDLSPDGSRAVFSAPGGLYVVGTDGRGLRRLLWSRAGDREPVWSPVVDRIAFARMHDGLTEIYVAALGAGSATQLTEFASKNATTPAWSPSGREIAFSHSDSAGYKQLFVMHADGTDPIQLTDDRDHSSYLPSWGP